MSKLFFFDIETTGIDNKENGIHQISAIIEVDGEVKAELDLRCRPFSGCVITPEALKVGGVTEEQIMAYPDEWNAYNSIVKELAKYCDKFNKGDKFHLVGYNNASFDNQFLRRLWDRCNDKYFGSYFWSDTIDVMVLASWKLQSFRSGMANFKLHTVAKKFGEEIDETKLHDANYDLKLTRQIYLRAGEQIK